MEWLQKGVQYLLEKLEEYLRKTEKEWFDNVKRELLDKLRSAVPYWLSPRLLREASEKRKRARILEAEQEALGRVNALMSSVHHGEELTFEGLYKSVKPPSPEWLAFAITTNLFTAPWKLVFRVKSPQGLFYSDFLSLEEIPSKLYDENLKTWFVVGPGLVTVVLKA